MYMSGDLMRSDDGTMAGMIQRFVLEEFGAVIDRERAEELIQRLRADCVPVSGPETRRAIAQYMAGQ